MSSRSKPSSGGTGRPKEKKPQDQSNDIQDPQGPTDGTLLRPDVYEPPLGSAEASTPENSVATQPIRLTWEDEPEPADNTLNASVLPPLAVASVGEEVFRSRHSLQARLSQGNSVPERPKKDYRPRRTSMDYAMTPDDEAPTKQKPKWSPAPSAADVPDRPTDPEPVSPGKNARTGLAIDPHQQEDFDWGDEADELEGSVANPGQQLGADVDAEKPLSPNSILSRQRELLNDQRQMWSGQRPIVYPTNTEAERAIVRRLERETTARLESFRRFAAQNQHELDEARRDNDSLQTVNRTLRASNDSLRVNGRRSMSISVTAQERAQRLEEERTIESQRADCADLEVERLKKQLASSKARESEAKARARQANTEIEQIQTELAKARPGQEASALTESQSVGRANESEAEVQKLKIQLTQSETAASEAQQLVKQLQERSDNAEADVKELGAKLTDTKASLEKAEKQVEEVLGQSLGAATEVDRLKAQLAEAESKHQGAQAQVEQAVKRASVAEADFEQSKVGVSVAESNIQIVQEKNAELLAINTHIQSELDLLKAAYKKLAEESEAEYTKVVDQNAAHLDTIDDLQDEDEANKKTIDDLRRENAVLRNDYASLQHRSQSNSSHDNSPASIPGSQPQTSHAAEGEQEDNSSPDNNQERNDSDNTNNVDNTEHNTELLEKDALISQLEQDLKDCHSHGELLQQQLTQKQDEMSNARQTIQQLEERVAELEEQVRVLLAERPSEGDEDEGSEGSGDPVADLDALAEQEGLGNGEEGEEKEREDPCSRCGLSWTKWAKLVDDIDSIDAAVKHWRDQDAKHMKELVELRATPACTRISEMNDEIVRLTRELEESREERRKLSDDAIHMGELRKEIATLQSRLSAPPRPVSPSPAALAEQQRLNGIIDSMRRELEDARRPRTRPNILTPAQLHTINAIIYAENVEMRARLAQNGVQMPMTLMRTRTSARGRAQFHHDRTELSTDNERTWALPTRTPPMTLADRITRARARHDQRMRSREQEDAEKQMKATRVQTAETMLRGDLREYWRNRFGIEALIKEQVQGELWKDIPLSTPLRTDKVKGKGKGIVGMA